jgi:ABC-type uncharacterized transport system fused permease/ATPase subunit
VSTLAGLVISWFVGWFLPGLEYKNQMVEAAFRKDLVLGEDNKIKYALPKTLAKLFFGLEHNYHKLFLHYGYFDLWYNMFDQVMIILPYVVVGPSVVLGAVPLGVLVQVSNAFGKVQGSLAVFIQNWTTITELRSIWKRLHEFEDNVDKHNEHIDVNYLKGKENELYSYKFGQGVTMEMLHKTYKIYEWPVAKFVKFCSKHRDDVIEVLATAPILFLLYVILCLIKGIVQQ